MVLSSLINSCHFRYRYVDVAFASVIKALKDSGIERMVISYDIACKFSSNFQQRVLFPQQPLLDLSDFEEVDIVWVVNQWHLAGHQESCADEFGLRYKENVGRFSGEAVETPWAQLDKLQYYLRVMTWGNRRDAITEAINHWNWSKTMRIGMVHLLFEIKARCKNSHFLLINYSRINPKGLCSNCC